MPYNASEYRRRKENSLCVRCGEKNEMSGIFCAECKEKDNETKRSNYRYFISIGICPRCHREKLYGDERACPMCRAYQSERRKKLDKEYTNEIRRRSGRKIYAESSAKGICTRCNKRKAAEGMKSCKMCAEKNRVYRMIRRGGIPRSERPNYGLCYFCGEKAEEGQKVCIKCHEKITEANRKHDNSKRRDFVFGKAKYDWEARRKEKVG